MGLLYKKAEDVNVSVIITEVDGRIEFEFSADSGKHHTEEMIAGFSLSPKRLLEILSDAEILDDELETGAAAAHGGMRVIVAGMGKCSALGARIAEALKMEEANVNIVVHDPNIGQDVNIIEVHQERFSTMIERRKDIELELLTPNPIGDCYVNDKPNHKGHQRPYKFHR